MSFRKSVLISVVSSLILGALAVLIAGRSVPRTAGQGYAVLTLDASYADRSIGAILSRGGIEAYISESTQWVYLDDFGELRQISLDEYRDQVESFDLRDDGYAERLRSFFVRDGKRRLFIPFSFNFPGETPAAFEKRLALLGLPPFSLEFLGFSRSLWPGGLLFILAAVFTLILSGTPLLTAAFLPLFAALAYAGSTGFALSVVLIALFKVLLDPVREFFVSRRYGNAGSFRGPGKRLRSFKVLWIVVPVFLMIYGLIAWLGRFPGILAAAVLPSFLGLLGICLWTESNRGENQGHIQFLPVPIRDASPRPLYFFRPLVPFALASLGAFFSPLLFPGPSFSPGAVPEEPPPISKEDYQTHAAFQLSFSVNSLEGEGHGDDSGTDEARGSYVRYYLGEDGLIAGTRGYDGEFIRRDRENDDIPPFPLEKLVEFLENYNHADAGNFRWGDIAPVLIALGLCLPGTLRWGRKGRRGGKHFIYTDKRIAA
jgi:hypothetical protein